MARLKTPEPHTNAPARRTQDRGPKNYSPSRRKAKAGLIVIVEAGPLCQVPNPLPQIAGRRRFAARLCQYPAANSTTAQPTMK
jgi:hypothetical protein